MLNNGTGSSGSTPIVIYVHCEAGEDRTGEISGAYYMQYLKWTFLTALDYDNHIESRHIQNASMHALQWCGAVFFFFLLLLQSRAFVVLIYCL